MTARRRITSFLLLLATAARAPSQEGTLDVMDGETLYQGGWLLTLGHSVERKEELQRGSHRIPDPAHARRTDHETVLGAHFGLRYDLQLSAIVPHATRSLVADDPSGPDRLEASGLGDVALLAKWRVKRWDAPHEALNLAVIAGLELPTGADDERDGGVRLAPELQPGSGSWDPMLGLAATYEPHRWRFNAAVLRRFQGSDADRAEDDTFAELAVGNRFWLEPYPGPFMRWDAMLRYRHQRYLSSAAFGDSGRDLVTIGANLAFRPRPSLDLQVGFEVPLHERVAGTQLAEEFSVFAAVGFRF